jgi:ABC-2 type transport system ATP-binding protein
VTFAGAPVRGITYTSRMNETPPPVLAVRHFSKAYGDFAAVGDLSLELFGGDILALVGPNGAGKTTTMRAISGILTPTGGVITIDGHDLQSDPVGAKAALAYVPDDPRLFDTLTVWEHLQFIAGAYRVERWKPQAEALLDLFELTPKRNALAMELSRGMRQKTAIACAYLHAPRLILLDEPLTGLDPAGIRSMKESIRRRAAEGAAVILSSHLLSLVEDLCTRVLIMAKGSMRFAGTIEDARHRFAGGATDASLEDVFFSATQDEAPDPTPSPAAGEQR